MLVSLSSLTEAAGGIFNPRLGKGRAQRSGGAHHPQRSSRTSAISRVRTPWCPPKGPIVDKQYELFCVADPLFYDSPTRRAGDSDFAVGTVDLPEGWHRRVRDLWVAHIPPGSRIPPQGWKIHVSACRDNAEEVL